MKRLSYAFILFFITFFFSIVVGAYGNDMEIKKNDAIEIANKEAKKLGYDVENMNIKITKHNTPWNDFIPKESTDEYYIERKNKLENKEYWAIYYYPNREKSGMEYKGGDFCIFIDSRNGEVITNIRWK